MSTPAPSVFDVPTALLDGTPTTLGEQGGRATLVVNVASRCGQTPQYEGLERLAKNYRERGLVVVGYPCNQFLGQEPGTPEEIAEFCSTTYGVTFPLLEKIEVNGEGRHAVYDVLTAAPDAEGEAGDVLWNFEKFLVGPTGEVVARFRSRTDPEGPAIVAAIEAVLED